MARPIVENDSRTPSQLYLTPRERNTLLTKATKKHTNRIARTTPHKNFPTSIAPRPTQPQRLRMDLTILTCRTEGRGFGPLQLALSVHLALLLLLLLLLLRMRPAVEAAGGGAEHAVMAGIMAGDTADDGALDAALGVGGGGRAQHEKGGGAG